MVPRITGIVPNFNNEAFLEKRMQSILRQSRSDFEVILLDGHSSNHSLEILNYFARIPTSG